MLVGWDQDGKPEIRMGLKKEFAKGMHDSRNRSDLKALCSSMSIIQADFFRNRPQHSMNESTTGLSLVLNPVLFILAIALASSAFKHYEIANEIFDMQPPDYDDHWILEWTDHMLDVPDFQAATCDGPTGKIQKSSSFSRQLTNAAQRAGFSNITIHDGRREALVKANGKALILLRLQSANYPPARGYSTAEIGKFAGQSNSKVFRVYYMVEGSVDGQNSFLNQPCRTDFIEDMRGISLHCNP